MSHLDGFGEAAMRLDRKAATAPSSGGSSLKHPTLLSPPIRWRLHAPRYDSVHTSVCRIIVSLLVAQRAGSGRWPSSNTSFCSARRPTRARMR